MLELVDSSFSVVTIMKYLRQATFFFFLRERGLFYFVILEFQGLEASSSDNFQLSCWQSPLAIQGLI